MKNYIAYLLGIYLIISGLVACRKTNNLPDPLDAGWKSIKVCELVEDNKNYRVLKCTFSPGIGHEKHFHDPHFGFTVSGSTFRIKDKDGIREVKLLSGSHFTSDGVDWHEVQNIGDSTAVFLIFEPK